MILVKLFVGFIISVLCAFNISDLDFSIPVIQKEFDVPNYVEIAREEYNNEDIVGRLYIESLDMDVPIVQSSDNDYYLDHDEYKKKNNLGAIFLDYRNNIDVDRKILIFGHNSETIKTEFKKIEAFLDEKFYDDVNNRKIVLETLNKSVTYEVSGVFVEASDFQHMKLSFTQEEWKKHIEWINNNSLYKDNFVDVDDEILIMQTCYYEPDDSYLLIIAKKVEEVYY